MDDDLQLIPLKTGVALEVAVSNHEQQCTRVAFCLHPWSRLGGCMYDPTVQTIVRSLDRHTLSYNARGVGGSTGWPSFTGKSEGEDLAALVQHFLEGHPHVNSVTLIVRRTVHLLASTWYDDQQGYSHGSLIATLHPVLPSHIRTSYVLLSYPLGPRVLLTMFHSKMYSDALTSLLRDARARLLIVHGDRDEFTGHSQYDDWTDSLKTTEGIRAQLSVVTVAGAGHFWRTEASRATLKATLENWLVER